MTESPDEIEYKGFKFPPEHAECIAEITSFWAALEYSVDMSIWHLAGVYPAIGACITSQIYTLNGRLEALCALLKLRQAPQTLIDRVNKFSGHVRKPLEIRNRITHDCWFKSQETGAMSQLNIGAKGVLTYGFKPMPIEPLRGDREIVRKAMRQATELRDSIERALPSLREIPLKELHPTVLHNQGHEQTRSIGNTFLLFPPRPSQA
jgi:hypothetical protein